MAYLNASLIRPDAIQWQSEVIAVQRVAIAASSSGNNAVVAAVAGFRILLLGYNIMSDGVVNPKWRSGNTDIGGRSFLPEAGRGKVAWCPWGWAITNSGEALNLNLDAAVAVEGEAVYALVPA